MWERPISYKPSTEAAWKSGCLNSAEDTSRFSNDVWERSFTYTVWKYEAWRRESWKFGCDMVPLSRSKTLVPHDRKVQIRCEFMVLIQIYTDIFDRQTWQQQALCHAVNLPASDMKAHSQHRLCSVCCSEVSNSLPVCPCWSGANVYCEQECASFINNYRIVASVAVLKELENYWGIWGEIAAAAISLTCHLVVAWPWRVMCMLTEMRN